MSMFPLNPLQRLTPRKIAKTGQVNRVIDAFNSLHPTDVSGIVDVPAHPQGQIFAVIWDAGPAAEADYTATSGGRYWVRASTISAGNPRDAITLNNVGLTGSSGSDDGLYLFTATNDAEIPAGVPRHTLPKNTPVTVRVEVDAGGVPRWVFSYPPPPVVLVDLTQSGGADGSNTGSATWTYTAKLAGTSTTFASGAALTVRAQRPLGKMTKATQGEAWWNGTAWVIWRCDEVPNYRLVHPDEDVACVGSDVGGTAVDVLTPT